MQQRMARQLEVGDECVYDRNCVLALSMPHTDGN